MMDGDDNLMLDGEGPVYDQIKRAIAQRIRTGDWQPGQRIPSEEELTNRFGTARMTVNRALRELSEEGLIIRRRRAGSFVAQPPAPSALLEIADMAEIIPARGQVYGYDCLVNASVAATPDLAEKLKLDTDAPLQHVLCRHSADGEIVELEERWINLALLPDAAQQSFAESGPGGWLLAATPWTEAEHTVSARNATPEIADMVGIDIGAACLVLERRTFLDEAVVTFARLIHPGERHWMTERFSPR